MGRVGHARAVLAVGGMTTACVAPPDTVAPAQPPVSAPRTAADMSPEPPAPPWVASIADDRVIARRADAEFRLTLPGECSRPCERQFEFLHSSAGDWILARVEIEAVGSPSFFLAALGHEVVPPRKDPGPSLSDAGAETVAPSDHADGTEPWVDLWHGSVARLGDGGVDAGPLFALTPARCDDPGAATRTFTGWVVEARAPTTGAEPSPALAERATQASCTPLELPLP